MKISLLTRPWLLLLIPVVASVIAWLVPGNSEALRGFSVRADLSVSAMLVLILWYTIVIAVFIVGARIGRAVAPIRAFVEVEEDPRFDHRILIVLTAIGIAGVAYALYLAHSSGLSIQTLSSGLGNQLSQTIHKQAGLATLRYTPVISAPIAVNLFLQKKTGIFLVVGNVGLLLVESLFSSRLSLIIAVIVFVFLLARRAPQTRIKLKFLIGGGVVMFGILATLNFFRNSGFYRANGVSNPLVMNFYQIVSYVGAPFQVSTGVAGSVFSGQYSDTLGKTNGLDVLVPSFFASKNNVGVTGSQYGGLVDIAPQLTANSAFADTLTRFGLSGLLLSLLLILGAAILFGHAIQYRTSVVTIAGVIGYALSDYWRILMFNYGLIVFLIAAELMIAVLVRVTLVRRQYPGTTYRRS